MFKELGQIASLMKQAQGMQGKIAETKERLANLQCDGEAGAGMVRVTVAGTMRLIECKIDPSLFKSGDEEMVEDLIVAAANQAFEKLMQKQAEEMSAITSGINLPGMGDAFSGMGFGK
ncbi:MULTISPECIES: YbaB/EbfC family nucleoid-associated protein [unclassified Schlesneria]|uniref:YbaB/EbfC family nucleoid-associated protein n=1 Tax=Schlesneria TaxID=656899 RepID=UPI002F19C7BF